MLWNSSVVYGFSYKKPLKPESEIQIPSEDVRDLVLMSDKLWFHGTFA